MVLLCCSVLRRSLIALPLAALGLGSVGCGHSFEAARHEPSLREPSPNATAATERADAPVPVAPERVARTERRAGAVGGAGAGGAAWPVHRLPVLLRPADVLKRPPARLVVVPPRPR